VNFRAGLDTEVRRKILCPCRRSKPDRPVVQSVVRHYTDGATPAPTNTSKAALCIHLCTYYGFITEFYDISELFSQLSEESGRFNVHQKQKLLSGT